MNERHRVICNLQGSYLILETERVIILEARASCYLSCYLSEFWCYLNEYPFMHACMCVLSCICSPTYPCMHTLDAFTKSRTKNNLISPNRSLTSIHNQTSAETIFLLVQLTLREQ